MTSSATPAVFIFNGTQIHAFADDNGETWFSASDVCAVLGYSNDSDAIKKYCREKGMAKHGSLAEGDNQELTYINEGNLYRLIINSREEESQAFEVKVSDLIAIGEIPAAKISKSWVFRGVDLDNYLAEEVRIQTEQRREAYQAGRVVKIKPSVAEVRGRRVLPVLPPLPVAA